MVVSFLNVNIIMTAGDTVHVYTIHIPSDYN